LFMWKVTPQRCWGQGTRNNRIVVVLQLSS